MSRGSMIGAYGAWAENLLIDPPLLSLRRNEYQELERWREQARGTLEELLQSPPMDGVPPVKCVAETEYEGLVIQDIEWPMPYGPPCRAYLLRPKTSSGRLPGVLALHDHGGNKYFGRRKIVRNGDERHPMMESHQAEYYGDRAWANELAKRGYVVLVPDAFAFASRRILGSDFPAYVYRYIVPQSSDQSELKPENLHDGTAVVADVSPTEGTEEIKAYNRFASTHEHVLAKSLFCAGLTWPGVFLAEDRYALSYLASLPEVDPARLGACGLSGGGLRTNYLAGLDERIAASVTVGFMTTWRDFLLHQSHTHTWMVYVPHASRYLDFPEILGLRSPKATLVLQTTDDPLYTLDEARRAESILTAVYQKAQALTAGRDPSESRRPADIAGFQMSFYPGPHMFNRRMQEEAFDWFDGRL